MGWNGSGQVVRTNGVFSGADVWEQSRQADRDVRSDDHDTHDEDVAGAIEDCLNRNGENSPTVDIPMAGFKFTNGGNAAARNQFATAAQIQDNSLTFVPPASVTGTANAILLAPSPGITAHVAGQKFGFIIESDTTSPTVTVGVSALTPQSLVVGDGSDLGTVTLKAGTYVEIAYDGTNFQLLDATPDDPLALSDGSELTISAGSITPTDNFHLVDTEADAATDDLTTISTANLEDGAILVLQAANASRDIVLVHNATPTAGQFVLAEDRDFTLSGVRSMIVLKRRGIFWEELTRRDPVYPVNSVVQEDFVTSGLQTGTTSVILADGSTPQNTEGTEVLSLAFTPKFASSKIRLQYRLLVSGLPQKVGALFVSGTADALAADASGGVIPGTSTLEGDILVDATDVSERTYSVRIGTTDGAETVTMNPTDTAFGIARVAILRATEVVQ